jgi:hypothetical protein
LLAEEEEKILRLGLLIKPIGPGPSQLLASPSSQPAFYSTWNFIYRNSKRKTQRSPK